MSKDIIQEDVAAEVIVEETVEVVVEETITAEAPLTKARTLSAINASLTEMSKEELDSIFEAAEAVKAKAKTEDDEEDDEEGDDEEGEVENEKKEAKSAKKEENFKEDLEALVKDEESLSEGFKTKAGIIFEAALQEKTTAKIAQLEEQYASDLVEEVEAIKEDLVDKVDGYLNYVVESWMKDNEVAIEHSLKSEITESFIDAMHGVFSEHYISVPEDKVDVIDALSEELVDAKDQLNNLTESAKELTEKVKTFERKTILDEACEGLAATEVGKLAKLCEGLEADTNADYATKVATIKESYLNKDEVTSDTEVDAITEQKSVTEAVVVTDAMASYLAAIKQTK
jgi:hypothetical protein